MLIQQNTAKSVVVWPGTVTGAGTSYFTGFTAILRMFKNGLGTVGFGGSLVNTGNGVYEINLDVTDTDTLGQLAIELSDGSTQQGTFVLGQVVAFNPEDPAGLGLTNLDAPVSSVLTDLGTVLSELGTMFTELGTLATAVAAVPAEVLDPTNGIDTALTPRQAIRLIAAALAGKISISGTTVTIRDTADSKNRIVATVDGTGQRTSLTYDKT